MLAPEVIETVVGELEIKGVFKTTKTNVVCGGTVTSGRIEPKLRLRIKRGGEVVGEGRWRACKRTSRRPKRRLKVRPAA
jgi:translation initiation factor IF-2